jgi:hypothetical protein
MQDKIKEKCAYSKTWLIQNSLVWNLMVFQILIRT